MEYITTSQAAVKWNITRTRITILANNGRIPGAVKIGHTWMIPQNVNKPSDGRTKKETAQCCNEPFRFPLFVYKDSDSFFPPLSNEEKKIKEAQEATHACRFDEVEIILGNLEHETKNRYIRIAALFTKCMTYIGLSDSKAFLLNYSAFQAEFQTDFPYKLEMLEYVREINATLGLNNSYSSSPTIQVGYNYHKSFLPYLGVIPIMVLFESCNRKKHTVFDLLSLESNCLFVENCGDLVCIQTANLYLGFCYAVIGEKKTAELHIKKALELAQKYDLLYQILSEYYYMSNVIEPVLNKFPAEFQNKIRTMSKSTHKKYVEFTNSMSLNTIFKSIMQKEYSYILYAVQGYSNKEIAKLLGINKNTIAKKYSNIYSELGVSGKKELVELYNSFTRP